MNTGEEQGYDIENSTTGTLYDVANPLIGLLADNGGPELPYDYRLLTYATLRNSPARNAGSNLLELAYDQRGEGYPRVYPEGQQPDIGAYEFSPDIIHTLLLVY